MILKLPEWYRIATIDNLNEDLLEKRSLGIVDLLNKDEVFFLECIRQFLGKKVETNEFDEQFFIGFNNTDKLYLKDDAPLLEKRVLSGAIIAQKFKDDTILGDRLAYALMCGSFGMADADIINKDIIFSAQEYLQRRAFNERSAIPVVDKIPPFKKEITTIESLIPYIKTMVAYTEKQLKHSQMRIDHLQEESDIHWWLFRSFSNLKEVPVADLPSKEAAFILAYELSKLITIVPAPSNVLSFLNKILKEVVSLPSKISLKQAAEILTELQKEFETSLDSKYGNLTPLIFAVSQRATTQGDNAWTTLFKVKTNINVNISLPTQSLALQFFNELMLLSIQ